MLVFVAFYLIEVKNKINEYWMVEFIILLCTLRQSVLIFVEIPYITACVTTAVN